MQIKVSISCPLCNRKSIFVVTDDMFGQQSTLSCSLCSGNFSRKIPPKQDFLSKLQKPKQVPKHEDKNDKTYIGGCSKKEVYLKLYVMQSEFNNAQVFDIDQKRMTIGRKNSSGHEFKPDVEIITTDLYMGRKHALILKKENNAFVIKDLNSANRTLHNGVPLNNEEEFYLEEGDELKLGRTIIKISITGKTFDKTSI